MFHVLSHALPNVPRIISAIIGFSFLYMALFMYQDQAGRIQNRLVNLWVRVNARHEEFLSKQSTLIKSSADIAEMGMRWLLGEKLISLQFIVISSCMSIASMGLIIGMAFYRLMNIAPLLYVATVSGVLHFFYGVFAARFLFRKGRPILASALLLALFSLSSAAIVWSIKDGNTLQLDVWLSFVFFAALLGVAAIGSVCDLILLLGSRVLFRLMSRTSASAVLFLGLCFSLIWLYVVLDGVLVVVFDTARLGDPFSRLFDVIDKEDSSGIAYPLLGFGLTTNLFNILAASSVVLILLVVLFHRIFWPSAGRVVYALYEWKIFADRKLQLAGAITFLSFAFPWVGRILKSLKG
jgi:hypothetical protein